jgi:serine/threonine protein kinase
MSVGPELLPLKNGRYFHLRNKRQPFHLISDGANAKVFKMRDASYLTAPKTTAEDGMVAVKIVSIPNLSLSKDVNSLHQEVLLMAKSHHENVVEVLDYFETETELCIVMKYCDCTLKEFIEQGQLKAPEVRNPSN